MVSHQLIVDDRERASGIIDLLYVNAFVDFEVKRLTVGDYLVDNWLLVERKSMADLVQSIITGRVFQQASRLAKSDYTTVIILEGRAQDIENYHIHRNAILGALVTISLIYGISILRSSNKIETLNLMFFAAEQKSKREQSEIPRAGYRPKRLKTRQVYILQGLPNIGPKLAKQLLGHFGSIQAVLTASLNQLLEVDGIGRKIAVKIYEILRASYHS